MDLLESSTEEPDSRGLSEKFFGGSMLISILTVLLAIVLFLAIVLLILCCKYVVMPVCPGCCKTAL